MLFTRCIQLLLYIIFFKTDFVISSRCAVCLFLSVYKFATQDWNVQINKTTLWWETLSVRCVELLNTFFIFGTIPMLIRGANSRSKGGTVG